MKNNVMAKEHETVEWHTWHSDIDPHGHR